MQIKQTLRSALLLTIAALIMLTQINGQCMVTESELRHIIDNENNDNSLTGFYISQTINDFFKNDVSISDETLPPTYDYFTIIPDGTDYMICSNGYTENHKVNARLVSDDNQGLTYLSEASTGEPIATSASHTDEAIKYAYILPPKMTREIMKNDSMTIGNSVSLIKGDLDLIYSVDLEEQAGFSEMFETTVLTRELTEEESQQVTETSQNDYANRLREVMNTGEIHNMIGADGFPSAIKDDRFMIITVSEQFYNRKTYFVLFENFNDSIWLVDYEFDEDGEMKDIVCFNKSYQFSPRVIKLIYEKEKSGHYWR